MARRVGSCSTVLTDTFQMKNNTVNALISDDDEVRVSVSRTQLLNAALWEVENLLAEAAGVPSIASHNVEMLN